MLAPITALLATVAVADTLVLQERLDRYEPSSGAFQGAAETWYDVDGRRLRLVETDADGVETLVFLVFHDDQGRESGAVYFGEGSEEPVREVFEYSADGLQQTTTYYYEPGVAADRVVSDLDGEGRERFKRYFRGDGSQYGEEDVLWDADGNQVGWDFRRVGREGGASFRYEYEAFDEAGRWTRRTLLRDGVAERREARTLVLAEVIGAESLEPVPFGAVSISSPASETSPSFSADGRTLVFARYGDDWGSKTPYVAHLGEAGWSAQLLPFGTVYNLAISPDGETIVFATDDHGERRLHRARRLGAGAWSEAEDLTVAYGLAGTYPCLTDAGDLLFYDAEGPDGDGIYVARRVGSGFGSPLPLYTPTDGTTFDAFAERADGPLLVTRCLDDVCDPEDGNGIYRVTLEGGSRTAEHLSALPYAWGAQPVPALGLLVFTDGDDLLAVPLERAFAAGS